MNEDAIITEGPASTEMQPMTVEDGSPSIFKPQESVMHRAGMFAFPCFIGLIYLVVVIFMIVMFYRLVRATEKIASKLESGITVNKENSDTI